MPVELKPTSVIKANIGIDPNGPVQAFFTHTCRLHMDKYVPYSQIEKQTDHLKEAVTETADTITYELPYAHAQYVGYTTGPVVNYTTPGTGPYWDRLMISAEGQDVVKEVQDYIGGK